MIDRVTVVLLSGRSWATGAAFFVTVANKQKPRLLAQRAGAPVCRVAERARTAVANGQAPYFEKMRGGVQSLIGTTAENPGGG
jgi:hypothetical protein